MNKKLKISEKNKTQIKTSIWKRTNLSENSFKKAIIAKNSKNLNNVSRNSTEADYFSHTMAFDLVNIHFNINKFNLNCFSFSSLANFNIHLKFKNNCFHNFYKFSIIEKNINFYYSIFEKKDLNLFNNDIFFKDYLHNYLFINLEYHKGGF
jgi:hypothetical protein